MSLLVVGCNHRSAGLALLERLAVPAEELPKALRTLTGLEHVLEAVVLSTCNRVEVYAHVSRFHSGLHELRGWFAERGDLHPQDLDEVEYSYHDDRAAAHLFAVAGGLDSMVIGEGQIATQVKQSVQVAREQGAARRVLQRLFRQAVSVGRRIRRETEIMQGASSMVEVGLEVAGTRLGGPVAGRRALIVGAGAVGTLSVERLREQGIGHLDVYNRSADKAARLAARCEGRVVAPGGLRDALAAADLVVCTTGAPVPLIDPALVAAALASRPDPAHAPLVLLDLAMPRNIDPGCVELPDVEVVDIADVRARAVREVAGDVLTEARALVDEEAAAFVAWTRSSEVGPTIAAVRRSAEAVRLAELERLSPRLAGLEPRQLEAVETLTRGIVNTLLHTPSVRLKELAERGVADRHADALRTLFDLVWEVDDPLDEDLDDLGGDGDVQR